MHQSFEPPPRAWAGQHRDFPSYSLHFGPLVGGEYTKNQSSPPVAGNSLFCGQWFIFTPCNNFSLHYLRSLNWSETSKANMETRKIICKVFYHGCKKAVVLKLRIWKALSRKLYNRFTTGEKLLLTDSHDPYGWYPLKMHHSTQASPVHNSILPITHRTTQHQIEVTENLPVFLTWAKRKLVKRDLQVGINYF